MKNALSIDIDPALIRPLNQAENEFIQVLLTEFQLRQGAHGLTLKVAYDANTPAIWLRKGKSFIRRQLDPASVDAYRRKLENVLLGRNKTGWQYKDRKFPFRFGNGGTLPVVRAGDKDYYCLFYREADPIGWNIANGGAESAAELLDPLAIVERELREELIIVEPSAKRRYVFYWNESQRADHPEFAITRRLWDEIFRKLDFPSLRDFALPLKWLPGSDSVIIKYANTAPVKVTECVLNITAEDFGIEIDRVAKMAVGANAIMCDGETTRGKLLDRVIGLFEVRRFNRRLAEGKQQFYPDRLFRTAKERSKKDFRLVIHEYLDECNSAQGLGPRHEGLRSAARLGYSEAQIWSMSRNP